VGRGSGPPIVERGSGPPIVERGSGPPTVERGSGPLTARVSKHLPHVKTRLAALVFAARRTAPRFMHHVQDRTTF
jgi:hypothetical protein